MSKLIKRCKSGDTIDGKVNNFNEGGSKDYYKRLAKAVVNNFTLNIDKQRERFYNHYSPYYPYTIRNVVKAAELAIGGSEFAKKEHERRKVEERNPWMLENFIEGAQTPFDDAVWGTYLNIPQEKRKYKDYYLKESDYKPSIGAKRDVYYTIPDIPERAIEDMIQETRDLKINSNKNTGIFFGWNMGTSTLGRGVDSQKGEYVSYSDLWDINPIYGKYSAISENKKIDKLFKAVFNNKGKDVFNGITNPIPFYDRIYLDNYYQINSTPKEDEYYGGYLPEVIIDEYNNAEAYNAFESGSWEEYFKKVEKAAEKRRKNEN